MTNWVEIAAWLGEWLATGGSLVVQTDYDGTLTPIVDDPGRAQLSHKVRGDLQALARSPQSRVAVISGRDIADLRGRVAVPEAIYAGCHGLEIQGPDIAFSHPEAEAHRSTLRSLSRALARLASLIDGMRVESKRLALAIHHRYVTPEGRRHIEATLTREVRRLGSRLRLVRGIEVIEILPRVHWNKGECAKWIQERVRQALPPPRLTLYMGDDTTDEHAFRALWGRGVTVRVGREGPTSRAAHRLEGVAQARQLLAMLAGLVAAESGTCA